MLAAQTLEVSDPKEVTAPLEILPASNDTSATEVMEEEVMEDDVMDDDVMDDVEEDESAVTDDTADEWKLFYNALRGVFLLSDFLMWLVQARHHLIA